MLHPIEKAYVQAKQEAARAKRVVNAARKKVDIAHGKTDTIQGLASFGKAVDFLTKAVATYEKTSDRLEQATIALCNARAKAFS